MRGRKMGAHTFREITAQLSRYESEGYDMDAIHTLPDTFCMAWLVQTPEARAFACRLGREVRQGWRRSSRCNQLTAKLVLVNWRPTSCLDCALLSPHADCDVAV